MPNSLLVTTTDVLEGFRIRSYLGPIFAHVVAGTNLFSDIAASWSDVFGGRSSSYQKQLVTINSEVIKKLEEEARRLGANGILSLRIDHDEISGSGKSMFMVTATGTAVRLDSSRSTEERETSHVSGQEMEVAIRTKKLLVENSQTECRFSVNDWEFVTANQVSAVATIVFSAVGRIDWRTASNSDLLKLSIDYFLALPQEDAKAFILRGAVGDNPSQRHLAIQLLQRGHTYELEDIIELLSEGSHAVRMRTLSLLIYEPVFYSEEDILKLERIAELVENGFPVRAHYFFKDKMFSSTPVRMWRCECGKEMDEDTSRCLECGKDIYGLRNNDLKPKQGIWLLEARLEKLKSVFK